MHSSSMSCGQCHLRLNINLVSICPGRVGIFSGNTVEWMLAMQAGNYYSVYIGEQHRLRVCSRSCSVADHIQGPPGSLPS
jgi:hypothetical protein